MYAQAIEQGKRLTLTLTLTPSTLTTLTLTRYAKAIEQGKRVLIYEGDSDDCGLQTAPIEDIWVPFLGNGTGKPDGWTPVGPLGQPEGKGGGEGGGEGGNGSVSVMPLGLPMSQAWRPFGVEPAGRKVASNPSPSPHPYP